MVLQTDVKNEEVLQRMNVGKQIWTERKCLNDRSQFKSLKMVMLLIEGMIRRKNRKKRHRKSY